MKTKINVRRGDIIKGQRSNCYECPVALATRKIFPAYEIAVGQGGIFMRINENHIFTAKLPIEAEQWVSEFDALSIMMHTTIKPITFDVEFKAE